MGEWLEHNLDLWTEGIFCCSLCTILQFHRDCKYLVINCSLDGTEFLIRFTKCTLTLTPIAGNVMNPGARSSTFFGLVHWSASFGKVLCLDTEIQWSGWIQQDPAACLLHLSSLSKRKDHQAQGVCLSTVEISNPTQSWTMNQQGEQYLAYGGPHSLLT